ncbi:MAG: hypothetical protein ABSH48_20090 [Verrucomicrobiota bacterium]
MKKYPFPYEAAFTVSPDIDSANLGRLGAVHALFCGRELISKGSPEWQALGLTEHYPQFDENREGISGLGFPFADSFFLVNDPTTLGMYRYRDDERRFVEDEQSGENCAKLIRQWLKAGQIDTFHAFLHYQRRQIEPVLTEFFLWCDRENVAKPRVWTNHSWASCPTGLCPKMLQPGYASRFVKIAARAVVGPLFGRKRLPLSKAFTRYEGSLPGSPYYVNDILAANGLRYVWLNRNDTHINRIILPEFSQNGRATILRPVTMDDGIRYWHFDRSFGQPASMSGLNYLCDSPWGFDASCFVTEENLKQLCKSAGTCIFTTHWAHFRSIPIRSETIGRFELLRRWRDAGRIWTPSTGHLLEWTRRRTFLRIACRRESGRLIVNIEGIDDPIFGPEAVNLDDLHGLTLLIQAPDATVTIALAGQACHPKNVHRSGNLFWLDANGDSRPAMHAQYNVTLENDK